MVNTRHPTPDAPFRNPPGILATPHNHAGELALAVYAAALEAVRAGRLMGKALRVEGSLLAIQEHTLDLADFDRVLVVGAGKASAAMAASLEEILGDRISNGIVVTKHGHTVPTHQIQVLEASHPIPDEDSVKAGLEIHALAQSAGKNDLVICLLSGGASALMELPIKRISLSDLQKTTSLLLRAGANISELNAVRSRLSQIKAGGLSSAAYPATLICLAISDVLGNFLPVIGSGPCLARSSDAGDPVDVIEKYGLARALSASVRNAIYRPSVKGQPSNPRSIPHYIIGDLWTALDAARVSAEGLGLRPILLTGSLTGEAKYAGKLLGAIAADMERAMPHYDCLIAGGETTVTVSGDGKGGRAQELAAWAAAALPPGFALLSAGTDGTDGPTESAGGLVDHLTITRSSPKLDVDSALSANDSYHLLEAADSLVLTGPTHSNVNDLVILVRAIRSSN